MGRELPPDEQRRMLSQLFESTSDVLWMFSADWEELIFVNDAYEEVWGRSTDHLEGEATDFVHGVHPDDRERVRAAMERISGGEPAEVEFRVNAEEGYGRWVWTRGRPVYDDGQIVRVAGVSRDVTARKRYEEELRRQNERLDEFASIVSHDLRSPLSVVQGRVTLARADCDCDCDEHLDPIDDAVDRMGAIVDDTLTLARQGERVDDMEWVDVGSLAEECWRMAGAADTDATLDVVTPFRFRVDPDRLRHVLENLFGNAVEHAGTGVAVEIGTLDGGFYVEDDGSGIPEGERDRVFQPGYSTTDDGTGFGLAIVRQVADAHGWTIDVTEGTAGGARFEFRGVEVDADR